MIIKTLRDSYLKIRKSFNEKKLDLFTVVFILFVGLIFLFLFFNTKPRIKDNIYREGVIEDVKVLTPYLTSNETEKTISNIIFPSLFEFDNGKLISKFVSDYSLNNEKNRIELKLFSNLFWSNGEKITTEDIRFGLEFAKKFSPAEISKILARYEFEVINEQQGVFKLETPNNYALYYLKYIKPLPTKIFSRFSPDFLNLEIAKYGSGPFVLEGVENLNNKKITLIRNSFFREKVYLERIEFKIFSNQREALNAFLLREIDGLGGFYYNEIPSNLQRRVKVFNLIIPRVIGIFFNKEKVNPEKLVDYLNNTNFRQDVLISVFRNKGEVTSGIFSPSIRRILNIEEPIIFHEKVKPEDINKNFEIYTVSSFLYPDISRMLRDKYGIRFKLVSNEELNQMIRTKNYSAILYGINYNFPPQLNFFFSQAGLNLNSISNTLLEKKFFELSQKIDIDPLVFNKDIEEEILKTKSNFFIINPYYQFFLSDDFDSFNTLIISEVSERFVKIQNLRQR